MCRFLFTAFLQMFTIYTDKPNLFELYLNQVVCIFGLT